MCSGRYSIKLLVQWSVRYEFDAQGAVHRKSHRTSTRRSPEAMAAAAGMSSPDAGTSRSVHRATRQKSARWLAYHPPSPTCTSRCNLDLDGDGAVRPHTDALLLARYLVNTTPGVDLTANAKNPNSAVTAATIQAAVEAMRDGLAVDIDGDGRADNKDAIIVMRALLGFRSAALVQGLSVSGSARPSGEDLRYWMVTNCGLSLP
jgi:Dockerin type I domain